jgi:hypothetical protein
MFAHKCNGQKYGDGVSLNSIAENKRVISTTFVGYSSYVKSCTISFGIYVLNNLSAQYSMNLGTYVPKTEHRIYMFGNILVPLKAYNFSLKDPIQ